MRLQLIAFVSLAVLSCGRVPPRTGHGEVSLHAGYYHDNDHVEVWTPSVTASIPITDRVTANGSYGLDMISAASVDVVASASRVVEQRHETTAGADIALSDRTTVQGTFRDSREPDYVSDGATLSVDHDSPRHERSYHAEVGYRHDAVGPGWVLQSPANLDAASTAESLTLVLDRLTLLRLALQGDVMMGYQSSVYRYVTVGLAQYPEATPELRVRGAGLARLQRSLLPKLAVYLEYNLSVDNWGLTAHTGQAGVRWEPSPWAVLDFHTFLGIQTAASFYAAHYDTLDRYRTRDRMLGGMTTLWPQLSVRLTRPSWPAPPTWELGFTMGVLRQLFDDFPLLPDRTAVLLESGITRYF